MTCVMVGLWLGSGLSIDEMSAQAPGTSAKADNMSNDPAKVSDTATSQIFYGWVRLTLMYVV